MSRPILEEIPVPMRHTAIIRTFSFAVLALIIGVVGATEAIAQNTSVTDAGTPSALAKGSHPLGSYSGGDFDTINLFNGNASFRIPLASKDGRAGLGMGVLLSYNSKIWRAEKTSTGEIFIVNDPWEGKQIEVLGGSGWTISAGRMIARQTGNGMGSTCGQGVDAYKLHNSTLTQFTFTAPDSTEYEFRDVATDGAFLHPTVDNCGGAPSADTRRGTKFVTVDGTAATFIADSTVYDQPVPGGPTQLTVSGTIFLRDGTRFGISGNGRVQWQQDRNGNRINYEYTNGRLTGVTDTLGRSITIVYFGEPSGPNSLPVATITWLGTDGSSRTVTLRGRGYQHVMRTGLTRQKFVDLFGAGVSNPPDEYPTANVIDEIELPGNYSWFFHYNEFAEVAHVATPAGGGVVYEYNTTLSLMTGGEVKRRVRERRAYLTQSDPGSLYTNLASKTTYTDPFIDEDANGELLVTEDRYELDGTTKQSTVEHIFSGSPLQGYVQNFGSPAGSKNGYKEWREGKELRTTIKSGTGVALQSLEYTWKQRAGWNGLAATVLDQPSVDPRLDQSRTVLKDSPSNPFTDTAYDYDQFNNVTNEKVYDYGTGGTRGPLLREVQRTYVTTYTAIGPDGVGQSLNYITSNGSNNDIIHRRSLVLSEVVRNATPGAPGIETQTDYEYDNYTNAANDALHEPMLVRSFAGMPAAVVDSRNANFNTNFERIGRGNVTRVTGASTDASATALTHMNYDVCGNVVATIGPRTDLPVPDRTVSTTYGSQYYFAYPTVSSRVATQAGGGSITLSTTMTYDINTGAVTSMTGFNAGEQTTFGYENGAGQLDRLLQVTHPNGAGVTTFDYSIGGAYPLSMTANVPFNATTSIWTRTEYDGLGRPTKTTREDAGAGGNVSTDTVYDSRGRVRLASNPYRPGETTATPTYGWTRMTYDAIDRPLTVTTASDQNMTLNVTGPVTSSYIGAATTVTDQAVKSRSTTADALGRTISVTEAPGGLAYVTGYVYDARGNLRQVTQGPVSEQQIRTFEYDGLSRMLRMTMPECDSFQYGGKSAAVHLAYDRGGNLVERADSRSIVTTNTYDSVDRILTTTYAGAGETAATPTADVSYFYDSAAMPSGVTWTGGPSGSRGFSIGRLVGVVTAPVTLGTENVGQTAVLYGYDLPGRVIRTGQLLDSTTYLSSVNVNEGGAPIQSTYPSGTILTPGHNSSGQVSSILRGASGTNYLLQSATYAPAGSLATERLGTGNSLYHTIGYNNRLQPTTIGLGTTLTGTTQFSALRLECSYGVNSSATQQNGTITPGQNNGNIGRIDITPGLGQPVIRQNFTYDSLNRLDEAAEHFTPQTLAHLTSLSPPQGSPGATNLQVVITGTALSGALAVTFSDPNVTATIVGTPSATSVTASVTIAAGTATGPKTVRVTTPAGFSDNTLSFLVTAASAAHDTIGLYDPVTSTWFQRYSNTPGGADNVFGFGAGGQGFLPIDGDWNLDGMDTVGLYAPDSGIFLTNVNASGNADTVFSFGPANSGWLPVAGDWNGDGTDSVGLFDPVTGGFFLKNVNSNGAADYVFTFGPANSGWKPVAGDWNGDGVDTIGLYDPASGTFYLRNANSNGPASLVFSFGPAGWLPLSGDWNNDGVDTIGAFEPSTSRFFLRNLNNSGNADLVVQFGGGPSSWLPVTGDWNGSAAKAAPAGEGDAEKTADVQTISWSEDYMYDRFGNRTDGVPITKTNNRINETGYSYDGPGNLLTEPAGPGTTKVYKYNAENKMWRAEIPDGTTATYVYDGEGRRVKKIVGTTVTRFVYGVNGEMVAEYNGSGVLQKEYVYGPSGLLATLQGSVVQYATPDHLGSPRVVTNGTGGVISRHDYLPFGAELMAGTGGRTGAGLQGYGAADGIRQQFTSKERDQESGLDYFGARYFVSANGRFTSIDPIIAARSRLLDPQRLNLYAYVRNNPLKYGDPDGRDLKFAKGTDKADQDRILKLAAATYRRETGRKMLRALENSNIAFEYKVGNVPDKRVGDAVATVLWGKSKNEDFDRKKSATTGEKTIDRTSGKVVTTLDLDQIDKARSGKLGIRLDAPVPSPLNVFMHEGGHNAMKDSSMDLEVALSVDDAEQRAEEFAAIVEAEPEDGSISEEDALKEVTRMFSESPSTP